MKQADNCLINLSLDLKFCMKAVSKMFLLVPKNALCLYANTLIQLIQRTPLCIMVLGDPLMKVNEHFIFYTTYLWLLLYIPYHHKIGK